MQASVLVGQGVGAKATLLLGATDPVPGDDALGARDAVNGSPQERTPQFVQRSDNPWRECEGPHGVGRKGVEDGVEEDKPPAGGEQQRTPPR